MHGLRFYFQLLVTTSAPAIVAQTTKSNITGCFRLPASAFASPCWPIFAVRRGSQGTCTTKPIRKTLIKLPGEVHTLAATNNQSSPFSSTSLIKDTRKMTTLEGQKPFTPHPNLTGLLVGSGSDGMNEKQVADIVLNLVASSRTDGAENDTVHVLYLGTPTYDLDGPRERQTAQFRKNDKCQIHSLNVVDEKYSTEQMQQLFEQANVIIVSGGNTLFAVDRWKTLGIDVLLKQAMERGAVLTGGSAGAIAFFSGGHSDSGDPESFKKYMLGHDQADRGGDESSAAPTNANDIKEWEYIRVPALGFIPGICCPHHDRVQSNGKLRADDFDEMLLRHPTEIGIGIDHWAALKFSPPTPAKSPNGMDSTGDIDYEVVSIQNRPGSVSKNGTFTTDGTGEPGIWVKHVDTESGQVVRRLLPQKGKLRDIFPYWPTTIEQDPRVEECRLSNPDDGPK